MDKQQEVTLDQLFAEREEEMRRFYEGPAGRAQEERIAEKSRREQEAQDRWALEHPRTPADDGQDAFLLGDEREPPEDLSPEDKEAWLSGYDEERWANED